MAVVYLELDDEITAAIKRIRAVTDREAIIVIPPGSMIATSRINFKLLVREAAVQRMNAVGVSDEPQVRALAISAGLPAYDSVAAAEQALVTFREQDRRLAERIKPLPERRYPAEASETRVMPAAAPREAGPSRADGARRGDSVPSDTAVMPAQHAVAGRKATRRRRLSVAPIAVLLLLALLIGSVAYGAYVLLPTATITLRPRQVTLRTPSFTVTADPKVAVADPLAGVIPAQVVNIPVRANGDFAATGIEEHDTRASGVVRFRSENTLNAVAIPADTVVSTADNIDFLTQAAVSVPRASFATGPTTADVAIRAVRGGTRGNVDAGSITVVPAALDAQLISVVNPDPTNGGKHVDEQVVSQADYDAALASLNSQLQAQLAAALSDPKNVPRGLTMFGATATLATPQPNPPAVALVGGVAARFNLALDTSAGVTAVNETQLVDLATTKLRAQLQTGQALLGTPQVTYDAGTVAQGAIVYSVTASAAAYSQPDPQQVIGLVRGKTLTDARAALEQSFGAAEITVWPDFVDRVPDQAARVSVSVVGPTTTP